MTDDETAALAEAAIEFHNTLHNHSFPSCRNLDELADQTRMVLGACHILGIKTKKVWNAVLTLAMNEAFDMALRDPTPEELQEMQPVLEKSKLYFERHFAIEHLKDALLKRIGSNHVVWRGWKNANYVHLVFTCLACGAHSHSWPDNHVATAEWLDKTYKLHCVKHGRCS